MLGCYWFNSSLKVFTPSQDLLKGHLARFSRAANALMPTTFTLPREYVAFVRAFSDGRTDVRDPSETLAGASASASNVSEASGKVVRAGNSTADISDASGHQVAAASWSSGDVSEASGRQGSASGVNADGETGGEESRCAEETVREYCLQTILVSLRGKPRPALAGTLPVCVPTTDHAGGTSMALNISEVY